MPEPAGTAPDDARPPTRRRVGTRKKLLLSLAATVVLLLLVSGAIDVLLAWADSDDTLGLSEEAHCVYDPELGWVNEKSTRIENLYGLHRHLTTNARGFRGLEEIEEEIPEGRYRIVCLGDSFTLGYGVDDASTYPAQLEAIAPAIQTVNLGQGGYGIDQCLLWYRRDAAAFRANLLILAFIAPDFDRILESRFNDEYPKPLLRVEAGALVLSDEPVPDDWNTGRAGRRFGRFLGELALFDLLDRLRWRTQADREPPPEDAPLGYEEVGDLIVRELVRLARERGQNVAFVLLPLQNRNAGRPRSVARWLSPIANDLGIPFLDLTDDFDALPPAETGFLYQPDGHLNSHGHRFVAETLRLRLKSHFPAFP